jgi:hypothetical protein
MGMYTNCLLQHGLVPDLHATRRACNSDYIARFVVIDSYIDYNYICAHGMCLVDAECVAALVRRDPRPPQLEVPGLSDSDRMQIVKQQVGWY